MRKDRKTTSSSRKRRRKNLGRCRWWNYGGLQKNATKLPFHTLHNNNEKKRRRKEKQRQRKKLQDAFLADQRRKAHSSHLISGAMAFLNEVINFESTVKCSITPCKPSCPSK